MLVRFARTVVSYSCSAREERAASVDGSNAVDASFRMPCECFRWNPISIIELFYRRDIPFWWLVGLILHSL